MRIVKNMFALYALAGASKTTLGGAKNTTYPVNKHTNTADTEDTAGSTDYRIFKNIESSAMYKGSVREIPDGFLDSDKQGVMAVRVDVKTGQSLGHILNKAGVDENKAFLGAMGLIRNENETIEEYANRMQMSLQESLNNARNGDDRTLLFQSPDDFSVLWCNPSACRSSNALQSYAFAFQASSGKDAKDAKDIASELVHTHPKPNGMRLVIHTGNTKIRIGEENFDLSPNKDGISMVFIPEEHSHTFYRIKEGNEEPIIYSIHPEGDVKAIEGYLNRLLPNNSEMKDFLEYYEFNTKQIDVFEEEFGKELSNRDIAKIINDARNDCPESPISHTDPSKWPLVKKIINERVNVFLMLTVFEEEAEKLGIPFKSTETNQSSWRDAAAKLLKGACPQLEYY